MDCLAPTTNHMETAPISGTDLRVSRVGLGTWAIGGWMWGGSDEADAIRTIQAAFDHGITLVDTAPVYGFGLAEEIVGKALATGGLRNRAVIATKVGLIGKRQAFPQRKRRPHFPGDRSIPWIGFKPITSTSIRCIGPTPTHLSKRRRRP